MSRWWLASGCGVERLVAIAPAAPSQSEQFLWIRNRSSCRFYA